MLKIWVPGKEIRPHIRRALEVRENVSEEVIGIRVPRVLLAVDGAGVARGRGGEIPVGEDYDFVYAEDG